MGSVDILVGRKLFLMLQFGMLFCLIRRILLFGLTQKVNKKVKAASASHGKTTRFRLKLLNSSCLLKQQ